MPAKVKVSLVSDSNLATFILVLAKECFPSKIAKRTGSKSKALVWCVEYALQREKHNQGLLTRTWEDLPPLRMRRVDTVMHSLYDVLDFTIYLPVKVDEQLNEIAKAKGEYEKQNEKISKELKYPKFRGLKRNVIVNCVKLVMMDICEYTITTGGVFNIEKLEKYYGVEVKK